MNFYLIAGVSLVSSVLASVLCLSFFPKLKWMDDPVKYGHAREAIPYSVGLVFVFLFVILAVIFLPWSLQLGVLLGTVMVLGLLSFYDDRRGVSPIWRFLAQVFLATLVVMTGVQVVELTNPFGPENLHLLWIAPVLSVFWIVFLTNLVNFLDGVSGLTSGVSSIGFWVIFGLSIWPGMHALDQSLLSVMALILAILAGVAAFFEFPKPRFLIGDSGTMFFGFMLGVLTLINGAKLATVSLVLLIPILDGLMVILSRIREGKKPWEGDFTHAHHRLLRMGFSERKLLILYYFFSLAFGLIALFAWNTFFKVSSLLVLGSGFIIFVNYLRKY